ncbi:MG2 domain-containing protein [Mucilaginibacter koreensis]
MSPNRFSGASRTSLIAVVAALLSIGIALFFVFRHKHTTAVNPAFSKYIESYTSGVISKGSAIRIKLAGTVQTAHAAHEALDADIFDFSPSLKGKAYWVDAQTIEFRPDGDMKPAEFYEADFDLGKVTDVPNDLKHFKFAFQIIRSGMEMEFGALQSTSRTSLDQMKLSGTIRTADKENALQVEKFLTINYTPGTTVNWQHDATQTEHRFIINHIKKPASGSATLTVNWDGKPIGAADHDVKEFAIPAIGEFKVIGARAVQDQDQYVEVQFSNPIQVGQEVNGLVGITGITDPAYTIDGSLVKIYAPDHLNGSYAVYAHEGVQDITGKKNTDTYDANVFFENRLPQVTIPGKGVILPDSGRLTLPFEAVNLKAVDVTIVKIYENNIPQYFQNNNADGSSQLRQVGRPVKEITIRLDDDKSLNLTKHNRFMLDIDHLVRTEPGAIYRVMIGFRKEYSLFNCKTNKVFSAKEGNDGDEGYDEGDSEESSGSGIDEDDDFWQRYDNYYPEGYNWNEREDPCSKSYYTKDKWASRNIMASNIGLIAKRGVNNELLVAVTGIRSAMPMSGVELELLDYQKQVLGTAKSDDDGFARFTLKRTPYLLVAKNGDERGYLKLDNGSSLSLSKFDVGGEEVQHGLKGFIYGERGVWRPGDSIYVTFMLEDKLKSLPPDHPVQFEFYNPSGQLYRQMVRTRSVDGFYSFHTATTTTSPTGNWLAKVKVGGAVFEKNIKVETIMPNRLKLDLSFGGKTELTKGSSSDGVLTARWLFGGVAQNLKAKVDAFLSPQTTSFKGFENYTFDDPTLGFGTQTQTVFDGRLNAAGVAPVHANINLDKQAPGQLRANFVVKVFEPGGNFSVNQVSLPYNVYNGYVGIKTPEGSAYSGMLNTDTDNPIDIAAVNTNGVPFAGTRNVEVEVYKVQWRWWWDQTGDELSNFTQNQYNKLVSDTYVTLNNGRGRWNLRVKQADWGRYLIRIKDPLTGHSTGKVVYVDYGERLQEANSTDATMLSFTSDKKSYKVGETATLTIPTGKSSRALISFETGSRVVKTVWIDTKEAQTQYKFTVESSMAPNVFVNVTLLQRHAQTANDLPIRMYGAIPLTVDDPATVLKPVISMPNEIKPESNSAITVSEASGKEMTYTVALVDEGLLDLTNFKTPNPHTAFYAHEALGVKTWDLYDYVIGAYGGGLERILSIGGDQALNNNKNITVNRFKPVVKFLGPFHLGQGQKQTVKFRLPQYVGSVRAMVIAGHAGGYGYAEKPVAVKKPLMLLATLPRVLGPGEHFKLPVTVFAMDKNIKTVSVQLQSNAFTAAQGATQQTLTFTQPGDQLLTFDLNVKDFVGVGKVSIIARSGKETAAYDVQLNIRNPNPPMTHIIQKELRPGETFSTAYTPIGISGTNKASLEISSIPAINLAKRLNYLIDYPHGCIEQTTSAAFPQLYINQLTELSAKQKAEVERNIKSALNRLNGFQARDGGFSYWPGEGDADEWGTNYAGHFMLAAQARGYALPVGLLDNWKRYQKRQALNWAPDSRSFYGADLTQAYRLYLLALARQPELGAMNRLKEFKYLSVEAKWRLAAAYKLAGQPEIGLRLIANLPLTIKPYKQLYGTYGSDLRDEAMILESLMLLGQRQKAAQQLRTVAAHLSQDEWYSTQTTAYALLAVAEYCGQNKSGNKMQFNYQLDKGAVGVNSPSYLWQTPVAGNGGKVVLKNQGSNLLYVRLIQQGQPAAGQEPVHANNADVLQMSVNYFTLKGKPLNIAALKQGTDFVAQVTLKNSGHQGRYDNMALTQVFPSGWEILNTRMMNNDEVFKSSASDYRDIRDDRVNTYFGLPEGQTVTYYVMLNAAYTGRYYLPAAYCEAMYNASINAMEKGKWVEVIK